MEQKPERDKQEFREALPMYADSRMFEAEEDNRTSVERRMLRQLALLVGLLLLQVILFAILIQSTVNL